MPAFESLPVELVADILGELDVASLVIVSYLSSRLRAIASDPSLNPWRRPILRTICNSDGDGDYEPQLRHLSVRHTVPRQNWVDILTLAKAEYVLFEMTLPNLKDTEWEECFRRRFLPGWTKWKTSTWKAAFLKCVVHARPLRHEATQRALLIVSGLPFVTGSSIASGTEATRRAPQTNLGQSRL